MRQHFAVANKQGGPHPSLSHRGETGVSTSVLPGCPRPIPFLPPEFSVR